MLRLLNDLCPSAPSMLASFLQPVLASFLQHVLAMLPYPAPMSELAQCNQNLPKSTSKARPTKKSDPQAGNQADTALLEGHMGPAQQGGCMDPVCIAHAPGQAAFEEKLLCSMRHTGM